MDYLARTATPSLEVEAPEVIDATAFRRKPGQLMIHLLNNPMPLLPWSTSREDRPNFFSVDELLPVRDLVIRLNEFKARSVRLPLRDQTPTAGRGWHAGRGAGGKTAGGGARGPGPDGQASPPPTQETPYFFKNSTIYSKIIMFLTIALPFYIVHYSQEGWKSGPA